MIVVLVREDHGVEARKLREVEAARRPHPVVERVRGAEVVDQQRIVWLRGALGADQPALGAEERRLEHGWHDTVAAVSQLSRRELIRLIGGAAALASLPACGDDQPASGILTAKQRSLLADFAD